MGGCVAAAFGLLRRERPELTLALAGLSGWEYDAHEVDAATRVALTGHLELAVIA